VEDGIRVPIDFTLVEDTTISWANYFLLQWGPQDGFVLSACQLRPPVILTDNDEARRQALAESVVKIRPVVRMAVSRSKLRALARLIDRQLEKFPAEMELTDDEAKELLEGSNE
jgi:hypothetical protein